MDDDGHQFNHLWTKETRDSMQGFSNGGYSRAFIEGVPSDWSLVIGDVH